MRMWGRVGVQHDDVLGEAERALLAEGKASLLRRRADALLPGNDISFSTSWTWLRACGR
ncbi:hypothetical protein [Streptomyces sp. NRRL F-2580]|uniref:hypothetical protein n=1 Tax=Streptomyces sp. NRRL F-2580 TaxID=1463841 RepID=UPI000A452A6C|nr:hypothetical protein [Streptomyces sp. NRRL F-2580]